MNCPFCQHSNAATSRACRVCGAPLHPEKPEIVPVSIVAPTPKFTEIVRRTFEKNAAPLIAANFLPDENLRVGLVRQNGIVQLWNVGSGEISSFSVGRLFRKSSSLCCALATTDFAVTGHQNGEVRWHNWNGRERRNLDSHLGCVTTLALSATQFYSGGNDGVIWATAINGRKPRSYVMIEGLGAMTTFAVSPDGTLIAVGCDDGAVCLWRFNDEEAIFKLDWTRREHKSPIESLSFSANGQSLISRDKSNQLCLWAAQTSYQLPLPPRATISHIAPAWASDNRLLAITNQENGVCVFDVALGILMGELAPFDEQITRLSFATAAPWLLVAGEREVAVWNIL